MNAQPKPDVSGSLFEKLFGNPEFVEDLPVTETTLQNARIRAKVINLGDMFTSMVHVLRSDPMLPEPVRKMGALMWDLVGHRVTPVACGPNVASMHFYVEIPKQGKSVACIMCPPNWMDLVEKDVFMQFGALVSIGSQARDYYNKRMTDGREAVISRAYALEAEYLHSIQSHPWVGWFKPNDYQQHVMKEYPKGLASLKPGLWYESKPFQDQQHEGKKQTGS